MATENPYPGLGVWAVCSDYGLEHRIESCAPPFGVDGTNFRICVNCARLWYDTVFDPAGLNSG